MDFRDYLNKLEDISVDHEPQIGDIVEIEMGDTLLETYIEDITEDGVVIKVDETALKLMIDAKKELMESKPGLWANIHAKRERIKHGSGERMRKPGSKGAPSAQDFKDAAKEGYEGVTEGTKLLGRKDAGNRSVRFYRDTDWNEYIVQFFIDEEHQEEADYHTDDKQDAIDTGNSWLKGFPKQVTPENEMDEAKYQGREVPLGKPMAGDVKKSKVYVKKPNGKVVKVNFGDKNMRIKKSNPKRKKSFRARHHCENPGPRWKARYWSCRAW